jgi:glycosyltransferase involved in cell wall biosynthesis
MKLASVVVPLESSRHTVRSTVDALLAQSYCGMVEIILVGDRDDPAWTTIWREIESGQVQAIEVENGDLEYKRAVGLEAASGDVLCVASEGVTPPRDWVAREVASSLRDPYPHRGQPAVASQVVRDGRQVARHDRHRTAAERLVGGPLGEVA